MRVDFGPDGGVLGVERDGLSVMLRVPEMTAEVEGSVWVSHADLFTAVRAQSARRGARSQVELALEVGQEQVSVVGQSSTSMMPVLSALHVNPTQKVVPGTLVVDRALFAERAAAVAIAAESGDTLPVLEGTRLDAHEMVATDRYRLASMPVTGTGDLPQVVAPARVLAKVLAATAGETLSIGTDGEVVSVHAENLTASLLARTGDYPRVASIAKGFGDGPALRVAAAALREVLAPHARGKNVVALTVTPNGLEVEVDDGGAQTLAQARVPVLAQRGETPSVHFNVGYFVDALKIAGSEHVWLEIHGPLKPAMVGSNVDPDRYCMIQPVRRAS